MTASEHIILWDFLVPRPHQAAFVRGYGPEGGWARLFARAPGFLGTALYRDASDPERFVTLDRWESAEAYAAFRTRFAEEYATLDREFDALTLRERILGELVALRDG